MDRLKNKTALIFGSDPITLGIAARFVEEGATVSIIDEIPALAACDGASGIRAVAMADGRIESASRAVAEAMGGRPLDILVIGGGDIPPESAWRTIDELDISTTMDGERRETALALAAAKAARPGLSADGGSIVFLFSPAGLYSEGGWADRTVTHHAKRGLARALAAEWGQHQIRVNTLVPFAQTPGLEAYRQRNPQLVDWRISKVAMRRAGDPVRDIGGAAVFLASDDTRFLTGSMIFADGGGFLTTPVVETSVQAAL